jgi:hypothetical protein
MLPLVQESTETVFLRKMNKRMNMLAHNNESRAVAFLVLELHRRKMDYNTLCLIILQQPSSPVTGKRHEKGSPCLSKTIRRISAFTF